MKLYLDDDAVDHELIKLLVADGHDVFVPPGAGKARIPDPIHFALAIRDDRVVLTYNYRDFPHLHELIVSSGGHHPGLLVVRKDNDRRDLKPRGIVAAIAKLLGLGIPIADAVHIVNDYR